MADHFITQREKLCKARYRGIITDEQFTMQMHLLFGAAGLSAGFDDDAKKASEIYAAYLKVAS